MYELCVFLRVVMVLAVSSRLLPSHLAFDDVGDRVGVDLDVRHAGHLGPQLGENDRSRHADTPLLL